MVTYSINDHTTLHLQTHTSGLPLSPRERILQEQMVSASSVYFVIQVLRFVFQCDIQLSACIMFHLNIHLLQMNLNLYKLPIMKLMIMASLLCILILVFSTLPTQTRMWYNIKLLIYTQHCPLVMRTILSSSLF